MTKRYDSEIVIVDEAPQRLADGTPDQEVGSFSWVDLQYDRKVSHQIDWERMYRDIHPDDADVDAEMKRLQRWADDNPDAAMEADRLIRIAAEARPNDGDPVGNWIASFIERLRRRHSPATRADVEDLFEDLLEVMVPPRPQRRKLGRPEKPIKDTLRILAGRWIGHNGRPIVRARLEEYLSQVAENHGAPISKDTAQRLAQEATDADRAHVPDTAE